MKNFGSFNSTASFRKKGAGLGTENMSKYAELEAEIDYKEALEE